MAADFKYKSGDPVSFKAADTWKIERGTYVSMPGYPGDLVAVNDGFLIKLYELSIGNILGPGVFVTVQEAYDDFVNHLREKGKDPSRLLEAVYEKLNSQHDSLKLLNPAPGFNRYLQLKHEHDLAAPYLYNPDEQLQLGKLLDLAKSKGAKCIAEFLNLLIRSRNTKGRLKPNLDDIESRIDFEAARNYEEKCIKDGLPLPNFEILEISDEAFRHYFVDSMNLPKKNFDKIVADIALYDIMFSTFKFTRELKNKFGYHPNTDPLIIEANDLFLYIAGGLSARNERRIAALPEHIEQLRIIIKQLNDR